MGAAGADFVGELVAEDPSGRYPCLKHGGRVGFAPEPTGSDEQNMRKWWQHILTALFIAALAGGLYWLIGKTVFEASIVRGPSMQPTLQPGDRCLINVFAYRVREPRRGEIVVYRGPDDEGASVKRVIALPGETVQFRDGQIIIDNRPLVETYLPEENSKTSPKLLGEAKYLVMPESYFLLGDNRALSADSRDFGAVDRDHIRGKVMFTF